MALQPGVIPLRPLTLGDIFNGAVSYIRTNPKVTLGLTAVVVIAVQLLVLILELGPLTALADVDSDPNSGTEVYGAATSAVANLLSGLATIVLSGMLTVVIGRAVFGAKITIGEAWQRIRDRILPLIGLSLLLVVVPLLVVVVLAVIVGVIGATSGAGAALTLGIVLGLAVLAAWLWLSVVTLFAPAVLVLERLSVFASISRSFALVRGDFWRVLGIWLLAGIVTFVVAFVVAFPFGFAAGITTAVSAEAGSAVLGAAVLASIGSIIGQIITTPFSAGVNVLLYTDRRIRAEAFDLVLRTGATSGQSYPDMTDHLWLTRR